MRQRPAPGPGTPPAAAPEQHPSESIPTAPMSQSSTLAELLSTWQAWSERDTLAHQITQARAAGDTEQLATLTRASNVMPLIAPLDALAANHQLAEILVTLQTQAIRAARGTGATWDQIANAIGATAEQACLRWLAQPQHTPPKTDTPTSSAA